MEISKNIITFDFNSVLRELKNKNILRESENIFITKKECVCNLSTSSRFNEIFSENDNLNKINKDYVSNNEINCKEKKYESKIVKDDNISISDDNKNSINHVDTLWIKNQILNQQDEEDNEFSKIISKNIPEFKNKNKQNLKLEKIYNKILIKNVKKKEKEEINKDNNYNNDENTCNIFINSVPSTLKILCKKINSDVFIESTRGYNMENNIYIMNMDKLVENLKNFRYNNKDYLVGFLYRDYTNRDFYKTNDIKLYWSNYSNCNGLLEKKSLLPTNKILNACLNNLSSSTKFKKIIGKKMMRFLKKTVQIINNKLIIDVIFYSTFIINRT